MNSKSKRYALYHDTHSWRKIQASSYKVCIARARTGAGNAVSKHCQARDVLCGRGRVWARQRMGYARAEPPERPGNLGDWKQDTTSR